MGLKSVKKILTILLVLLLPLLTLTACLGECVVLEESKTYETTTVIESLDIKLNAGDFKIEPALEFSVESNLKYLSVTEEDGVLKIVDEAQGFCNFNGATLTLYIPVGIPLVKANVEIGAGKLTAESAFSVGKLTLNLGAGECSFASLYALNQANVKNGAGKITVASGTLNNLTIEVGMGELNLTARLLGDNDLTFGVGESNVVLVGEKADYNLTTEKGLGSISIDGKDFSAFTNSENGQNKVKINGGVGAINLTFKND